LIRGFRNLVIFGRLIFGAAIWGVVTRGELIFGVATLGEATFGATIFGATAPGVATRGTMACGAGTSGMENPDDTLAGALGFRARLLKVDTDGLALPAGPGRGLELAGETAVGLETGCPPALEIPFIPSATGLSDMPTFSDGASPAPAEGGFFRELRRLPETFRVNGNDARLLSFKAAGLFPEMPDLMAPSLSPAPLPGFARDPADFIRLPAPFPVFSSDPACGCFLPDLLPFRCGFSMAVARSGIPNTLMSEGLMGRITTRPLGSSRAKVPALMGKLLPLIFVATIAPSNNITSVGCGEEMFCGTMFSGFDTITANWVPRTPIVALDVCTPYSARSVASLFTRNRALPQSRSSFALTTLSLATL